MRTYSFRLYPNENQLRELERTLETHRRLYNQVLQHKQLMWDTERYNWTYYEQTAWFCRIRKSHPHYCAINAHSANRTLRRIDKAFSVFFCREKAGYPRFKSQDSFNSFEFETWSLKGGRLRLTHIGTIKVKLHREMEGKCKLVRVVRDGDKWFVQFVCETPKPAPTELTESVGVDVGIKAFATTSDGEQLGDSKILARNQKELRRRQRALSRCKKGSNRRKKVKVRVTQLHAKVRQSRKDMHHKVSRSLVDRYGVIAVESLNIQGMLKNHRLARSIADAGWGQFIQILTSKAESAGGRAITIDPKNTSQQCSACGQIVRKDLSVRIHRCDCGLVLDRDHNAARNILARALPEFAKQSNSPV